MEAEQPVQLVSLKCSDGEAVAMPVAGSIKTGSSNILISTTGCKLPRVASGWILERTASAAGVQLAAPGN